MSSSNELIVEKSFLHSSINGAFPSLITRMTLNPAVFAAYASEKNNIMAGNPNLSDYDIFYP
jgi:hypothetical protein